MRKLKWLPSLPFRCGWNLVDDKGIIRYKLKPKNLEPKTQEPKTQGAQQL